MRRLSIIRILDFYDIPQLFVAQDAIGSNYLCHLYDMSAEGELSFIGVMVSPSRLSDFINGHVDLRTVFQEREIEGTLFSVSFDGNGNVVAEIFSSELLEESMLPEENYFYDDSADEDQEMIERAATVNKTIVRLAFETEDNRHDIDAKCFSKAIANFQSLVDNSYRKLYKESDSANSRLRISAFKAASFDVELIADEKLDVFGQSQVARTLDVVNDLFASNSEKVVQTLRKINGLAVGYYRNFVDALAEHNMSVKLKWVYSTVDHSVHRGFLQTDQIPEITRILTENQALSDENCSYDGVFTAANVESGKWTLMQSDGQAIKGECSQPLMLSGITLDKVNYKIQCVVKQSINSTTLKESNLILLQNFE